MKTAEERLKAVLAEITELEILAKADKKMLEQGGLALTVSGVFIDFAIMYCERIRKLAEE